MIQDALLPLGIPNGDRAGAWALGKLRTQSHDLHPRQIVAE